jgi:adenylosuccinate lyase
VRFQHWRQIVAPRACPISAPLLIVVTLSVVDRIVKPEASVYLGLMFGQRDNVLDLLEALNKVLTRVVVAMWLGVATENIAIEAPELRGIVDP